MTDLSLQRLKEVVAHIETHPEEWNQTIWCGQACCLGGHAGKMAGAPKPINFWSWDDARSWFLVSTEEADWLFSVMRTLADFHAFIAARGTPEDVK